MGKRLTFLYLLIPALVVVAILAIPSVPTAARTNREDNSAGLDGARQAAFLACLDKNSREEKACLDKMGINAWYPRDDTECVAVAKRINAVFAVGGLPRWPALFRNERCARLGMPHHEDAAAAGTVEFNDRSYIDCYNIDYNQIICGDIHGRHRQSPRSAKDCGAMSATLGRILDRSNWESNFANERCWRLGWPHYEAD